MKNKLKYLIIIFVALIFTITLTSCENKTKLYVATSLIMLLMNLLIQEKVMMINMLERIYLLLNILRRSKIKFLSFKLWALMSF